MTQHRIALATAVAALLATTGLFASGKTPVIANEGAIGGKWMLADGTHIVPAAYPPALAERKENVCLALGYLIGEDGKTSNFAVLKQWNSASGMKEPVDGYWKALAEAGAGAVTQWRFKPRPEVTVVMPTYTVTTISFKLDAAAEDPQGKCRIADLADHIGKMKASPFERGGINRQFEERERMQERQQLIDEINRRANGG